MKIAPFKLEQYFSEYEFSAPYLLSSSDCEALTLAELLAMADEELLRLWQTLSLGYTETQGHPLLRAEIARLYTHVVPDDVLVLAPEEGIFVAMNVLLAPGDHVVATFPGYQSLYELAQAIGCTVSRWVPRKQNTWVFDVNELRAAIRHNTKLIVINFPHNPTGAMLSLQDFEAVLAIARERGIFVFSDEMYRFLEPVAGHRLPAASDLYDGAVSLFGVSKSFSSPGLRIGWLTTRNRDLLRQCLEFKTYTTICNNAPGEILALIALRARDLILQRNLTIIRDNLAVLDSFFARHAELFEWIPPQAGPIAFPALRHGVNIESFCRKLVKRKGVMLLPGTVYDYPGNHFRISACRLNMPVALARLEQYLAC